MCLSAIGFAQNEVLAKQYFDDGDFEKAVKLYENLHDQNPANPQYTDALVSCYQQLEQYDKAEHVLNILILKNGDNPSPALLVDLGYNFKLQGDDAQAQEQFSKAMQYLEKRPTYAYTLGRKFQEYTLIDEAIATYEKAMEINSGLDMNFQIARLYGEQGNMEQMFTAFVSILENETMPFARIVRSIEEFVSTDATNENNIILKKLLLKKSQTEPKIVYNEVLSWLFVQQEQFNMAFIQEKAIYKRTEETSLERIIDLANTAKEQGFYTEAKSMYTFMLNESTDNEIELLAKFSLLDIKLKQDYSNILEEVYHDFEELITAYPADDNSIFLHIRYADFLAFDYGKEADAIAYLKNILNSKMLNNYSEGAVKMKLGDILILQERFNEALIYYTQIQRSLKNDVISQDARFKVAKASFYKGDFKWAETQLDVLKSSTSQLIANDALELKLLIADNSLEDSLQTALKLYAKADLLAYQKKNTAAIDTLDIILTQHKGESIEDEALLMQAQLFVKQGEYDKAVSNYEKILAFFSDDILADNALYYLSKIYLEFKHDPEKAKTYLEKIIFEHQDSIYFTEARKTYRELRGDVITS